MSLNREQVLQLKEAGYSYHDIAQVAKCPTPVVMQLGQYGTQPDKAIDLDVDALLKAKTTESEEKTKTEGKK